MKIKYITVLDSGVKEVFQYKLEIGATIFTREMYEEFITKQGHRLNNIEWMEHNEPTIRRKYYTN